MTSPRRAARAAGRVALVASGPAVPRELLDPAAAVWQDQRAYHRYMNGHRWSMPPSERMGVPSSAGNRRSAAAAAWAVTVGACTTAYGDGKHRSADWNALRAAGLCD